MLHGGLPRSLVLPLLLLAPLLLAGLEGGALVPKVLFASIFETMPLHTGTAGDSALAGGCSTVLRALARGGCGFLGVRDGGEGTLERGAGTADVSLSMPSSWASAGGNNQAGLATMAAVTGRRPGRSWLSFGLSVCAQAGSGG